MQKYIEDKKTVIKFLDGQLGFYKKLAESLEKGQYLFVSNHLKARTALRAFVKMEALHSESITSVDISNLINYLELEKKLLEKEIEEFQNANTNTSRGETMREHLKLNDSKKANMGETLFDMFGAFKPKKAQALRVRYAA